MLNTNYKVDLINFINEHWKENHIFVRNSKIFDLQHKYDNKYTFVVNRKNNKINSVLGYIYTNSEFNSFWLAIWKSIDKQGGGMKVFFQLLSKKPEFVGVIGISQEASAIYKKLKWNYGELSHYYLTKNANIGLKHFQLVNQKLTYTYSDSLNENEIFQKKQFLPKKDYWYYKRRFINHPVYNYMFFKIPKHNIIFIGRIVNYSDLNVFHVVDVIGELHNVRLKDYVSQFIFNESIDLFEMMLYDSRGIDIDLEIKKNNQIIPTYFSPFLHKNININISYFTQKKMTVRFFIGDSDQDRPN